MKKTLIAMFALASVAMADTVNRTDILALPNTTTPTAWVHGAYSEVSHQVQDPAFPDDPNKKIKVVDQTPMEHFFAVYTEKDTGYYFGGRNNSYSNPNPGNIGEGNLVTENNVGAVTLCGRSGVAGDTFAFVLAPASDSIGLFYDTLTLQLSGNQDNTLTMGGDLIIAIANGSNLIKFATSRLESVKTSSITTVTLTLDKPVKLTDSTKIIAAFLGDGGTATTTYTINGIAVSAHCIPEPATATLSLLALAGLASRRRRH